MEVITAIKDIVLAVAGSVTAWVAVRGINKWRQEHTGKATFECARALAKATYRLRDELYSCRNPFISGAEYPDDYFATRDPEPAVKAAATAHVYQKRWEPIKEAVAEFEAQALEAEVLLGPPLRKLTDEFRACVVELRVAIEAVIDNDACGGKDFEADRKFGREMRSAVSGTEQSTDNKLTQRINAAIEAIEGELKKHLRST